MKPYFSKSGAWVSFDYTIPSDYYIVTVFNPAGSVHDRIRCDDYRDALAYRRSFIAIAKNWG